VGECPSFRESGSEIRIGFDRLLYPDCWWLIVVDLAGGLNQIHLRRRLIHVTYRRRLIHTPLQRWLIVDLRGLGNKVLHRQQVRVRQWRSWDIEVGHSELPLMQKWQKANKRSAKHRTDIPLIMTNFDPEQPGFRKRLCMTLNSVGPFDLPALSRSISIESQGIISQLLYFGYWKSSGRILPSSIRRLTSGKASRRASTMFFTVSQTRLNPSSPHSLVAFA
jgi:hypothetical protein